MSDYLRPKNQGPENTEEWVEYILNEIPVGSLIHQARVAGSPSFIRVLRQEGFEGKDLDAIHNAFGLRFLTEEIRIPREMTNCTINYFELAEKLEYERNLKNS